MTDPDQDDLINASVVAAGRGDHTMLKIFGHVMDDHDDEGCPAAGEVCAGYQLARDYLSGRLSFVESRAVTS